MMWQVEQAMEPSQAPRRKKLRKKRVRACEMGERNEVPSRSMSHSCARERMSSPSLASIVLMGFPLWSLKWRVILTSV